jgi:hypothetical protein
MGVRFGTLTTKTSLNSLPANSTETVVYAVGPMILAVDSAAVLFNWFCTVSGGTGLTALVIRLRRGTTTAGTLIMTSPWTQSAVAAQFYMMAGCDFDVFPAGDTYYCLTISQTGATGAGALNDGYLQAYVL